MWNDEYSPIDIGEILTDVKLLDIDSNRGQPGSTDNYIIKFRRELDDEYKKWNMNIYGIELD